MSEHIEATVVLTLRAEPEGHFVLLVDEKAVGAAGAYPTLSVAAGWLCDASRDVVVKLFRQLDGRLNKSSSLECPGRGGL